MATSPPSWHTAVAIALLVVAAIGAVITGVQLLVNLSSASHHNGLAFGRHTVHEPVLTVLLALTTVLLVAIAAGSRVTAWAAVLGAVLGVVGTVTSAIGLARGGAAGPAPAAYWWLLTIIALALVIANLWAR